MKRPDLHVIRNQRTPEEIVDALREMYLDPEARAKVTQRLQSGTSTMADALIGRALGGDEKALRLVTELVTEERGPRKGIRTMTDAEVEIVIQNSKRVWEDQ